MPDGSAPQPLSAARLTFPADTAFQRDLRSRVDAYFVDGRKRTADRAMWSKAAFWMILTPVVSLAAFFAPVSPLAAVGLWTLAGFCLAFVAMNVGHDAIHGSLSKDKRVNDLFAWTFDALGASSTTWRIAHNLLHHTYTNVPGVDTDIEPGPLLRFHTSAKRYWFHRFQAVYAWGLYCFVAILWVYQRDYMQMAAKHPRTGKHNPASEWMKLFAGKAMHIGFFVVVPLTLGVQSTATTLIGYLCFLVAAGLTLSVVFQLAHVVEGIRYISPEPGEQKLPRGWMEHELLTTANFGSTRICTFFTGGLDYQIEHHLFPTICHTHYRALSPIVAACAADHGIPYLHSGSFLQACASHTRMLARLGRGEDTEAIAPAIVRDAQRLGATAAPIAA